MTTHTPAPAQEAELTDDEITNVLRRLAVRPGDHDFNLGQCIARAIESALLSKLGAPVADERAAFERFQRRTGLDELYLERHATHGQYMWTATKEAWDTWQARAALASAPVAGEAHIRGLLARWELQRHAANEWADMACNGVQWIRNIRDGISTAEEALENLASNMTHCRETQARAGTEPPAAPQASEEQLVIKQCVLHGPAPEGFADWYQWLEAPVKTGAFIRAATADDWKRSEDASQASEAQDLEAALGAALCRANSAEAMWHKCRDELKAAAALLQSQASEAVRDAPAERLHALVREAISWIETGGGRADSLCADLRKALDAQRPGSQQKYWLCCGSKDPNHPNRRAPDCFNATRAKWGTADQHSKTARAALSAQPGAQKEQSDA